MTKFMLNPDNTFGRFRRTIRIDGREPRGVVFTPDELFDLDDDEQRFMAGEIAAQLIVPRGFKPAPKPKPAPPIRDPLEDDPDEKPVHVFDRPLPSEAGSSWASKTFRRFFPHS